MGTSSLVGLRRPGTPGRSRFSKALPAPPPMEIPSNNNKDVQQLVLPARKDSLPTRPALPPKDNVVKSIPPPTMATKVINTPLPPFPGLTRVNSPPTTIPKRKPVGSGISVKSPPASTKSPPPPQPARSGDISPVESISSLLSAYGTEDSTGNRYSQDTAATKHSFTEPSPPKVLPKDSLGSGVAKLDIVSPFALPTPVSSKMNTSQQGGPQARPPTPPEKDSNQRPTTPKSSRAALPSPPATDNTTSAKGSPGQPQLWRRRSLKSVKPLTVPELKLATSHGSTASARQVTSSVNNGLGSVPKPEVSRQDSRSDSPILNGFQDFPAAGTKPFAPLSSENMGHKTSREDLDGFSEYAQELEKGAYKTAQYSPARMSPEIQRPPTPEYANDEARKDGQAVYSPASALSPATPPEDARPLSMIPESPERPAESTTTMAAAPPSAEVSGPVLPPRSTSRPGVSPLAPPAARPAVVGLPRSPRPVGRSSPEASPPTVVISTAGALAPSPQIRPAATPSPPAPAAAAAAAARATSPSSISPRPATTTEATDDGEVTIRAPNSARTATSTSTITGGVAPATTNNKQQQQQQQRPQGARTRSDDDGGEPPEAVLMSEPSPTGPRPGDPTYFPMRHYLLRPVERGTVLPAAPLKRSQLACLGNHYRFVPSRNEEHPVACQSCEVRDNGARFTCAHCAVRLCGDCRDVLFMNGRDLGKLVEMLNGADGGPSSSSS